MSGRVLNFDDPTHQTTEALLPWFVNGTLKDEELASVELHLKECARCQREVDWLREMRAAYAGSETLADAAPSFHKLRRRLDESRMGTRLVPRLRGFELSKAFSIRIAGRPHRADHGRPR